MGELLAMYQLERRGVECAHVDRVDYDLWAKTPSGRYFAVQVKAAHIAREADPYRHHPRYKFKLPKRTTADLYAVVALDAEVVVIFPAEAMKASIPASTMTREAMDASIREYLS